MPLKQPKAAGNPKRQPHNQLRSITIFLIAIIAIFRWSFEQNLPDVEFHGLTPESAIRYFAPMKQNLHIRLTVARSIR